MLSRDVYVKYLASKNLTERDVAPIIDPTEQNSMLAIIPALLAAAKDDGDDALLKFLASGIGAAQVSTTDLLEKMYTQIAARWDLHKPVYVGAYPTSEFDGEWVAVPEGSLILINEGMLQLVGGFAQLYYSRQTFRRKRELLSRMIIEYRRTLTVPENSAFTGKWADFDPAVHENIAVLGTAAETFVILHEYGHVVLGGAERGEENELMADAWALDRLAEKRLTHLMMLGPILFLGLCHLVERVSQQADAVAMSVPRTHPGALLRLSQAGAVLRKFFSPADLEMAVEFLKLVDAAGAAATGSANDSLAGRVLNATFGLAGLLPEGFFESIAEPGDRLHVFKALVDMVSEEEPIPADDPDGTPVPDDHLPSGLRRSGQDSIFCYELPTGDDLEMVLIPKGSFLFGPLAQPGFPGPDDEPAGPPKEYVIKDDYYIGRYPVLKSQYEAFCSARGRKMPSPPSWPQGSDHPSVNITVRDAEAFCGWAGLRLPTEPEWEKAVRGPDGRVRPWGNNARPSDAADSDAPRAAAPDDSTASPFGVQHAIRNVWEITADWLASENPQSAGRYRVVRGGSYRASPSATTVMARHRVGLDFPQPDIGFRVVLAAPEGEGLAERNWMDEVLEQETEESSPTQVTYPQPRTEEEVSAAGMLFPAASDLTEEALSTVIEVLRRFPEAANWRDPEGCTPLLLTARHTPYFEVPYKIATLLVNNGADVNAQSPDGATALHMLAMRPQWYSLDIAQLLLDHGADLNIRDNRGCTIDMAAERYQHMMGDGFVALLQAHRNRGTGTP